MNAFEPSESTPAVLSPTRPFYWSVRRELWENRSIYLGPLAVAAAVLLGFLISAVRLPETIRELPSLALAAQYERVAMPFNAAAGLPVVAAFLIGAFYCLDALHGERRDRSILFWKSLPVSDLNTVLSKFAVAMVVVPLGVFVLATVMYPILYAIAAVGVPNFSYISGGWNTGEWLRAEGSMLAALIATQLWYAPLAAWNMLASVMSRRSPILIAVLPIVVLTVCERVMLHTSHLLVFAAKRMMPVSGLVEGLQRPSMWIGLAVAAGMLYIVVRLRRYRDDT